MHSPMKYQHALCLYPYYAEPSALLDFLPPVGLEYVATAVAQHVAKVTLIDLRREQELRDMRHLLEFIREQVDLLGVSVNWAAYFEQVCNLLNLLPADIPLIVGGRQATVRADELLQRCPQIDILVKGEGEETIQEIAQGKELHDIQGIAYRQNGQIVHTPQRTPLSIETLHYPDRTLRRYPYALQPKGLKLFDAPFDVILSARGCPRSCTFCSFPITPSGQRRPYSARSPESVVAEIGSLKAEVIAFADDDFFVDAARTERICDLLLEQGIQKTFLAHARIEIAQFPATLLRKLEQVGFKALLIGIESPHDRILHQLHKGFTAQDVRQAFQTLQAYGFFYHCTFICGNIGERREEMLTIPRFARAIGADSINVHRLQAWDGTPLKAQVEQTPGYALTPQNYVYSEMYGPEELKRIRAKLHRAFYTPAQLYRIIRKLYRIRVLTGNHLLRVAVLLPRLVVLLARHVLICLKKRRGGRKKGIPFQM